VSVANLWSRTGKRWPAKPVALVTMCAPFLRDEIHCDARTALRIGLLASPFHRCAEYRLATPQLILNHSSQTPQTILFEFGHGEANLSHPAALTHLAPCLTNPLLVSPAYRIFMFGWIRCDRLMKALAASACPARQSKSAWGRLEWPRMLSQRSCPKHYTAGRHTPIRSINRAYPGELFPDGQQERMPSVWAAVSTLRGTLRTPVPWDLSRSIGMQHTQKQRPHICVLRVNVLPYTCTNSHTSMAR